jgi:CheY-like chemotaxis protein
LKTVRCRAAEKNISLRAEVGAAVPESLVSDGRRILQIAINLLGNAVKFTERGEVTLRIEWREPSATLELEVEDTGIGIEPAMLEAIFEPFRQIDGSTSRKYAGTGLGLSIVSKLARNLRGTVEVDSAPGRGSRFRVLLPVGKGGSPPETTGAPKVETRDEPGGARALRILLAEDNEVNRRLAQRLLERMGHAVEVALNGLEALRKLGESSFDLVLMDLQMPEMDGMEATRRWRAMETGRKLERTPIVALTAHAMAHHEMESIAAGLDGFVTKPFSAAELEAAISAAAEGRSRRC